MSPQHRLIFAALATLALTQPVHALDRAGSQVGTWRAADSPHVVTGDISVPAGQTLAIEAGSVVLVAPDLRFDVGGTLVANGTPESPIRLRSLELQPRPGDWQGLSILGGGAAWFSHFELLHATEGLTVRDGSSLDAEGLTVADCLDDGVLLEAQSQASLSNSTLERNGAAGLVIEGGAPFVVGCTLRLNDVAARMNASSFPIFLGTEATHNRSLDGVLVDTTEPVSGFGSWHGGAMPFVVADGERLRIAAGAKLGLAGNTCLKFGMGARLEVEGDLSGGATAPGLITFTSLLDDEALGDTNRDGDASAPFKGDWDGIDVMNGGLVSLTGTELRLASDALRVQPGGRTVLFGARVHSNAGRGLAVGPGGEAFVQDSSFHDNDTGLSVAETDGIAIGLVPGNGPTGGGNSFHCNAAFDIENGSGFVLQAWRNFWGGDSPDAGRFLGSVDTGEHLIQAPAPVLAAARLELRREADTDLRFDWSEVSSCARYQVTVADLAGGVYASLTNPSTEETHLEPGGALPDGRPVRYFKLLNDLEAGAR